MKLELRLSDPITETEKLGYDVDEVLNRWQLWENKLKERNLSITTEEYVQFLDDPDNDNDQEENNDEKPI